MATRETKLEIWSELVSFLGNAYAAAGVMGNLQAESGLNPVNLQNSYERSLGMTDQEYTKAVDSNKYMHFADDNAGYGLAQWTYRTRKQNMLAAAKVLGVSIGSLQFQLYFICRELENYSIVMRKLMAATSVRDASDVFLLMYEKPSNTTEENQRKRAELGQIFYDELAAEPIKEYTSNYYRVLKRGSIGNDVRVLQQNLMELGYSLPKDGADGKYGSETERAVTEFQLDCQLVADGIAGSITQDLVVAALFAQKEDDSVSPEIPQPLYTVTISHLDEETAAKLFAEYERFPVVLEEEKP